MDDKRGRGSKHVSTKAPSTGEAKPSGSRAPLPAPQNIGRITRNSGKPILLGKRRSAKSRVRYPIDPNCTRRANPAGPSHPLNQLDEDEIRESVSIIKSYAISQGIQEDIEFISVTMKEPPKAALMAYLWEGGPQPPRKAEACITPIGVNRAYELVVNLQTKQMEIFQQLATDLQPSFNTEDTWTEIVHNDPRIIERARKIGITDMKLLICEGWAVGHNETDEDFQNNRMMCVYMYKCNFEGDNHYAHPVDFYARINMVTKVITEIIDLPVCAGAQPPESQRPQLPPEQPHNFDPSVLPPDFFRKDVKPIEITQPQGPSFEIVGNTIKWQRWEIIIGFNFREGLTLHNVSFDDHGTKRKVLYRAALSEMVVPYGDPRDPYNRKSAFDCGEDGLGYCANSLTNGCDCLGDIRYMDFVYAESNGEPQVTENAICIHEQDNGLLQKHTEYRNDNVTLARSRKLVISSISTIANYDYMLYWNFHQDGTIKVDVQATGLLSTHMIGVDANCEAGTLGTVVAPRIIAPYHQHIFCVRIDPMIDGMNNSVTMQEVIPLNDSAADPLGMGITTRSTILERAGESPSDMSLENSRSWVVINENVLNPHTQQPVGWKLVTPGFSRMLATPQSPIARRAGFGLHDVWVTPYDEDQLFAGGKYVNQAPPDRDGLHLWVKENGVIRNRDIVIWHTLGLTHVPRVEDFPLMPTEGISFMFRPSNFFDANPALDVPGPPTKKARTAL